AAEFRIYRTGHDVADFDSVVPHLLHQRLAESVETELRGVIGGHARVWISAGQRRNVDDVTATPLLHFGDRFVAAIENAEQIRFQHRAKVFGRGLFDAFENTNTRVVDENVEAAQFFDGEGDQGF